MTRTKLLGLLPLLLLGACGMEAAVPDASLAADAAALAGPPPDGVERLGPLPTRFDGYYEGMLTPQEGSACPADVGGPVRRSLIVVDGRASFGMNFLFAGEVAADGTLDLQQPVLGRLFGRITADAGHFAGVLVPAGRAGCRWSVELARTASPTSTATWGPAVWHAQPSRGWRNLVRLASDGDAGCGAALNAAERRHGTLPGLLGSIARVESGRKLRAGGPAIPWPWTVNADGRGYFFESKDEALAWVRRAQASNSVRMLDVGCMQVNLQHHPTAFASLEDAFDPAANADYAARFLRQLHGEAGGDWTVAAGLYHSRTPELAAGYRARLAVLGTGILTGVGGPEPLYLGVAREGQLFLPLANGRLLLLNPRRQPVSPGYRRASACQVVAALRVELAVAPSAAACARPRLAATLPTG